MRMLRQGSSGFPPDLIQPEPLIEGLFQTRDKILNREMYRSTERSFLPSWLNRLCYCAPERERMIFIELLLSSLDHSVLLLCHMCDEIAITSVRWRRAHRPAGQAVSQLPAAGRWHCDV
jgi:hypothetical protein